MTELRPDDLGNEVLTVKVFAVKLTVTWPKECLESRLKYIHM